MAKHIAAPATVEELVQTLGITREDREIVDRVLRELGEYDRDSDSAKATESDVLLPIQRPDRRPKKNE